jgi:hypothetical protein
MAVSLFASAKVLISSATARDVLGAGPRSLKAGNRLGNPACTHGE